MAVPDPERSPALRQFMICYFNQNYDLTYGSFEACLAAFIAIESEALCSSLLGEMEAIEAAGCVFDIAPHSSSERQFWRGLGGARLVPRHLTVAREILASA